MLLARLRNDETTSIPEIRLMVTAPILGFFTNGMAIMSQSKLQCVFLYMATTYVVIETCISSSLRRSWPACMFVETRVRKSRTTHPFTQFCVMFKAFLTDISQCLLIICTWSRFITVDSQLITVVKYASSNDHICSLKFDLYKPVHNHAGFVFRTTRGRKKKLLL